MQFRTFSFSSYFLDQPVNDYIVAKTCSCSYLINKSYVWTVYIVLLAVNMNCLTRKMKLNIPLTVNFVLTLSCSAQCCRQILCEGTNIPIRRKTIDRSCTKFFNSAAETEDRGWRSWYKFPGPDYMAYVLSFSIVSLFVGVLMNPFITSSSHSATESQSLQFSVNIFSRPALPWGDSPPPPPGPQPAIVGPIIEC
jgi:hypothetical protein